MAIDIHPASEVLLIIAGVFLFVDGLIVQALSYNYSVLGLTALDPFVNHIWIGLLFIAVGGYELLTH